MIRRRPPAGVSTHKCGPEFSFKVPQDEANEPINILEEIVWYKDQEIKEFREERPLSTLATMAAAANSSSLAAAIARSASGVAIW